MWLKSAASELLESLEKLETKKGGKNSKTSPLPETFLRIVFG